MRLQQTEKCQGRQEQETYPQRRHEITVAGTGRQDQETETYTRRRHDTTATGTGRRETYPQRRHEMTPVGAEKQETGYVPLYGGRPGSGSPGRLSTVADQGVGLLVVSRRWQTGEWVSWSSPDGGRPGSGSPGRLSTVADRGVGLLAGV